MVWGRAKLENYGTYDTTAESISSMSERGVRLVTVEPPTAGWGGHQNFKCDDVSHGLLQMSEIQSRDGLDKLFWVLVDIMRDISC
jgi:hypothetical protein